VRSSNGKLIEECTDDPNQVVCQFAGLFPNVGDDAVELMEIVNFSDQPIDFDLIIQLVEGPTPRRVKYVWFDFGADVISVDEFDTASPTLYGHANAAGAEAVGASAWYQTEEWGSPFRPQCIPACLNNFSSAGGVPILFGANGQRLSSPQVRNKPGVVGPDGGNTTFFFFNLGLDVPGSTEDDQFPNFFGTSASAPHVAAVAALMMDQRERDIAAHRKSNKLTPQQIFNALHNTADDMKLRNFGGDIGPQPVEGAPGFDFDTGFGFVDALKAIQSISAH
jgi:subtilisin family serine protease